MNRFYDNNLSQHNCVNKNGVNKNGDNQNSNNQISDNRNCGNRKMKRRFLPLLSLLFILFIIIFLLILLNSCNSYHSKLPAHDLIIKLKVTDDEITAESESYLYRFSRLPVGDSQDNSSIIYDHFMRQYQKFVENRAVVFNIFEKHVEARYALLVNLALMSSQEILNLNIENRNLKNPYHIKKTADKDKIVIAFSTTFSGEYFSKEQRNITDNLLEDNFFLGNKYFLDDNYLLATPIPVMINDITYRRSMFEEFYGGAVMTLGTLIK
ncbi:hypothetical protein PT276_02640 [Orbaceae bacterium ESL0721]|nr:hypothetical protein [Orbaceae bacterium ESL0721]